MNPQLVLLSQEALNVEKFAQNGLSKEVHAVTKNMPFVVELGSHGTMNLNKSLIQSKLLYDYNNEEEPEKLVDSIRQEPLEYKAHIAEDGASVKVECRIKVLTSQHANSLFRVRFIATCSESNSILQVTSHPVKVVSKPKQAMKSMIPEKKKPKESQPIDLPTPAPQKRKFDDVNSIIVSSLSRLEKQQSTLLKMFSDASFSSRQFSSDPESDFQEALTRLLDCYDKLESIDRPAKVQKALCRLSVAQAENLCHLSVLSLPSAPMELLNSETLSDDYSSDLLEQDLYSPDSFLLESNLVE